MNQPIGKNDLLHATALGKVVLSGFGEIELEVYLRSSTRVRCTNQTITNSEVLAGVIRSVRKEGYATDFGELHVGVHCMAVSIYDHSNRAIAAIGISGPSVHLIKERMEGLRVPLLRIARELSRKMGFIKPSYSKKGEHNEHIR